MIYSAVTPQTWWQDEWGIRRFGKMKQRINILSQYVPVVLLLGGLISCASKSVESIVVGEEVRTLIAELHKVKTCEVYRLDDSFPVENRLNKGIVSDSFETEYLL